jgi:hypothetical protein
LRQRLASRRLLPSRNQANTVAVGCVRLPAGPHGKEGVDGSSPSEGFAKSPHVRASCFGSICRLSNVRTGMEPFMEPSGQRGFSESRANCPERPGIKRGQATSRRPSPTTRRSAERLNLDCRPHDGPNQILGERQRRRDITRCLRRLGLAVWLLWRLVRGRLLAGWLDMEHRYFRTVRCFRAGGVEVASESVVDPGDIDLLGGGTAAARGTASRLCLRLTGSNPRVQLPRIAGHVGAAASEPRPRLSSVRG